VSRAFDDVEAAQVSEVIPHAAFDVASEHTDADVTIPAMNSAGCSIFLPAKRDMNAKSRWKLR